MSISEWLTLATGGLQLLIAVVGVYIIARIAQKTLSGVEEKVGNIEKKVDHIITGVISSLEKEMVRLQERVANIIKELENGNGN
jgi:hypothetical protein